MKKHLLLFLVLTPCISLALELQVYTTTFIPVSLSGKAAEVFYLDEPDLILSRLTHFQGSNAANVRRAALNQLNSPEGKAMLDRLKIAFHGLASAWAHDIRYLPAIVVNDEAVIYGETDLNRALALYEAYRQGGGQ